MVVKNAETEELAEAEDLLRKAAAYVREEQQVSENHTPVKEKAKKVEHTVSTM